MKKHLVGIVIGCMVGSSIGLLAVQAQDTACPVKHVCVDYEGSTIVLDPLDGPVQAVGVQKRDLVLTGFDGATERHSATLAVYIADGDTFNFAGEVPVDKEGRFSNVDLEVFYALAENN